MTLQHLDILIGFATIMLGVSLVITIFTQIVSAVLGLRGTNLRWGVQKLLSAAVPPSAHGDSQQATAGTDGGEKRWRSLADTILHDPLISDSTFSKFTGWKGFKWLIGRFKLANAIRKKELIDILNNLDRLQFPEDAAAAGKALKSNLETAKKNIGTWFDTTMDRVSQRFAMSLRLWTVFFAIALVAGLHLDSVDLLRKLSQDPVARARLVASADAVVRETSNVLGASGETNVFVASIDQLKQMDPEAGKSLTNAPPPLLSLGAANFWLRNQLDDQPQAQQILATYQRITSSNILARAPELMGDVATVHDQLAQAGLDLIPDYKAIELKDYSPFQASFWGMLLSALLLSLGAPFWFNLLKALTNLRPVLATRMQKQEEGGSPK